MSGSASVPLTTAQEFFDEIGTWLADGADGSLNENILKTIKSELKAAPAGKRHKGQAPAKTAPSSPEISTRDNGVKQDSEELNTVLGTFLPLPSDSEDLPTQQLHRHQERVGSRLPQR
ncbi:MAG: hypothetical protein H9W81_13495 [Enterococcus sp.]|nr:hypothetical protein [Enterococcus sp.]